MASLARAFFFLMMMLISSTSDARSLDMRPAVITPPPSSPRSSILQSTSTILTKVAAEARGQVDESTLRLSSRRETQSPTASDLFASFAGCMCVGLISCA